VSRVAAGAAGALPTWAKPALALVGLGLALYGRALTVGWVGDDFIFLDAAVRTPLLELLTGRHGIVGFYRPLSRELYFWWWGKALGLGPFAMHLINALTFAAVLALLHRLAARAAGERAAWLACAAFMAFPGGGALLAWVSCAQDLIALFWTLAALALARDRRPAWAGVAVAFAGLSKETGLVAAAWVVLADLVLDRPASLGARARRLTPVVLGAAAAIAIQAIVRSQWPAGTAVAVWSPAQAVGAWKLPWLFARSLLPPGWSDGAGELVSRAPWLPLAALACVWLVVGAARPTRTRGRASQDGAAGAGALVLFGVAAWLVALMPVAFILERWRSYFFGFAAVGSSLVVGSLLARTPRPFAWVAIGAMAFIHLAANAVYRPQPGEGPGRHPYVNIAFFRDASAMTTPMLQSLRPWCDSLRAVPRIFAVGLPPDATFQTVLGPGARVTCRAPDLDVRFLPEMTPEDARGSFALLRPDPQRGALLLERASAMTRARIGEGFLVYGRYPLARACFDAASADRGPDPELAYPAACARAADGDSAASRDGWLAARGAGAVLEVDDVVGRLVATATRGASYDPDSLRRAIRPLVARAFAAPWRAAGHRALGRALVETPQARVAALELSIAAGISGEAEDVAWLATAYEGLGATDEARLAYETALSRGLPAAAFERARKRFMALGGATAGSTPSGTPGEFGRFPGAR
jgi:hypothetical protein